MESTEEFSFPIKIRFRSNSDCDVGSVYADRLVHNETKVVFYHGKVCVAVLNEEHLVIGSRTIRRSCLDPQKPFSRSH